MENEETKTEEEKRDFLSVIFILQAVFISVLLVSVYVVKILFPSDFSPLKEWITEKFYQNTSVKEIFDNSEYLDFTENDYSVY